LRPVRARFLEMSAYSRRMNVTDSASLKRAAAARALDYVEDGMKLGLGTGSTADLFLELLSERLRARGWKVIGTPTSQRTADRARALNIPLADLDDLGELDLVIDGADEADHDLNLIKGGGGALLREKIVAASGKRMLVIADESKLVKRLGAFPLPIEVVTFGHRSTARRLASAVASLGCVDIAPKLRLKEGRPYLTDNGNYIYDCPFGIIPDPPLLARHVSLLPGVVEHGLFTGMASALILAGAEGIRVIER
jgi:ribose 5-phosphate isomerase A